MALCSLPYQLVEPSDGPTVTTSTSGIYNLVLGGGDRCSFPFQTNREEILIRLVWEQKGKDLPRERETLDRWNAKKTRTVPS